MHMIFAYHCHVYAASKPTAIITLAPQSITHSGIWPAVYVVVTALAAGVLGFSTANAESVQPLSPPATEHFVIADKLSGAKRAEADLVNDAPGGASYDLSTIVQIPDLLDNLYKYNVNSTSDLVTYRTPDGTLMQLFTYWAADRRLHITERAFPDGMFTAPVDIHTAVMGDTETLEYDSHNASAVGVAPNGVLFATGNHHVDELNMAFAPNYNIRAFSTMPADSMVSKTEANRVTYPSFFTFNNHLYFSYREQEAGDKTPRFRWLINRYDHQQDKWTHAVQFHTGISLRMYVSNIVADKKHEKLHLFFTWRDDTDKSGRGPDIQRDYIHLSSANAKDWHFNTSTTTVNTQHLLWYDNGQVKEGYTGYQPTASEKIWSYPADPKPRSAGVATVDDAGHPHSLVKANDGTLYHHAWSGTKWQSRALQGWTANSVEIINCPDNVAALLAVNDKIYYRSLDATRQSHAEPVLLAEGFTTGNFSLSVDKEAINSAYVSFLLTRNTHFRPRKHDHNNPLNTQPAWIATFHCDELESATPLRQ